MEPAWLAQLREWADAQGIKTEGVDFNSDKPFAKLVKMVGIMRDDALMESIDGMLRTTTQAMNSYRNTHDPMMRDGKD